MTDVFCNKVNIYSGDWDLIQINITKLTDLGRLLHVAKKTPTKNTGGLYNSCTAKSQLSKTRKKSNKMR